jgi:nucleoside-diphosphate-sugar epimerase
MHSETFRSFNSSVALASNDFLYAHRQSSENIRQIANILEGIDWIVNVSGPTNIQDSFTNRELYLNEPLLQVEKHLKAIEITNKRIGYVYMSSAAVYGDCSIPAIEDQKLSPESPYAEGKQRVEEFLFSLRSSTSLHPIYILRTTSTYNSHLDSRVLSRIRNSVKGGESLVLSGDGSELRDFLHTEDLWDIICNLISIKFSKPEIFNVGVGRSISISNVVQISDGVRKQHGQDGSIKFSNTRRPGDPKRMQVDIQKIRALGIEISVPPLEGLRDFFESY